MRGPLYDHSPIRIRGNVDSETRLIQKLPCQDPNFVERRLRRQIDFRIRNRLAVGSHDPQIERCSGCVAATAVLEAGGAVVGLPSSARKHGRARVPTKISVNTENQRRPSARRREGSLGRSFQAGLQFMERSRFIVLARWDRPSPRRGQLAFATASRRSRGR